MHRGAELEKGVLAEMGHLLGGKDAVVVQSSLLCDAEDAMDHGMQAAHLDYMLDASPAPRRTIVFSETAAMPDGQAVRDPKKYTMILFPGSHKIMWDAAVHHLWTQEDGFKHSSSVLDEFFSRNLSQQEPARMTVDPYYMLTCDSRLAHGGRLPLCSTRALVDKIVHVSSATI